MTITRTVAETGVAGTRWRKDVNLASLNTSTTLGRLVLLPSALQSLHSPEPTDTEAERKKGFLAHFETT